MNVDFPKVAGVGSVTGANATLVVGSVAYHNKEAALVFYVVGFIIRLLLSMNDKHGEMERLWTVFTLFLNFQFIYGSPSSYDLHQGFGHAAVAHRHRNR